MIVRRIEVEAFKCFLEPRAIDLEPARITVVAAPNGSGKSTLMQALRCAFLFSHKSADGDIKSIAPWGRTVSPRVAVDFEAEGRRYRIEKRYLQGASAKLSQEVVGRYDLLAEGPMAEEKVRQFAGMRPGFDKGAKGKNEFWTSVLWTPQGDLALANVDGTVVEQVRASLGSQLESGIARQILIEAERFAAANWPEKKSHYIKNSPVRALEDKFAAFNKRALELASELENMAELREAIGQLDNVLSRCDAGARTKRQELDSLRVDLEQLKELTQQAELERIALQQARGAEQTLLDAVKRREQLELRLSDLVARSATAAERLQSLRVQQGEATLDDARRERDLLTTKRNAARDYVDARSEKVLLEQRILKASAALARHREIQAGIDALKAVPRGELESLKDLERQRQSLKTQLQGALVRLEFRPDETVKMDVLEGEPAGPQRVSGVFVVSGSPRVRVRVEGVGEWTASGPTSSAQEIRAKLQSVTQSLRDQLASTGATSIAEIEERRARADALDSELREQSIEAAGALAGETLTGLEQQMLRAQLTCRQSEELHPTWTRQEPSIGSIDAELASINARITLAEQLQGEVNEASADDKLLSVQRDETRRELERVQDGATLHKQLDEAILQRRGHELQLDALEKQAGRFPQELATTGAALEQEIQRLDNELLQKRQERASKQGALEEKSTRSPHASLTKAEEELADVQAELEREKLRAEAALLLRNTLRECRDEALSDCAGRVATGATELLSAITRARLGSVRLDPGLAPAGLVLASVNDEVELATLSGGEHEQVHFATRLALADVLCENEPQLVVFDDALMATDGERMKRILEMLEERRERMQVLLLTCHPERYRSLRQPALIELA